MSGNDLPGVGPGCQKQEVEVNRMPSITDRKRVWFFAVLPWRKRPTFAATLESHLQKGHSWPGRLPARKMSLTL